MLHEGTHHTVGEESCSVYLINDGVRVDGRNVSVSFTGTGPVESYFCKMDDSSFIGCECIQGNFKLIIIANFPGNSPFTSYNLEQGVHTVRVKTQKCGAGDRRLSFKFIVCDNQLQ